jgi:hypothetical protein
MNDHHMITIDDKRLINNNNLGLPCPHANYYTYNDQNARVVLIVPATTFAISRSNATNRSKPLSSTHLFHHATYLNRSYAQPLVRCDHQTTHPMQLRRFTPQPIFRLLEGLSLPVDRSIVRSFVTSARLHWHDDINQLFDSLSCRHGLVYTPAFTNIVPSPSPNSSFRNSELLITSAGGAGTRLKLPPHQLPGPEDAPLEDIFAVPPPNSSFSLVPP